MCVCVCVCVCVCACVCLTVCACVMCVLVRVYVCVTVCVPMWIICRSIFRGGRGGCQGASNFPPPPINYRGTFSELQKHIWILKLKPCQALSSPANIGTLCVENYERRGRV